MFLAIETSQREGGIALRDRAGSVHVEMLQGASRHHDDLLAAIDRLFSRHNLNPRDLTSLGVSLGPGGFTGLRIAVATAKMLGESLNCALIGVPSALVVAESLENNNDLAACTTIAVALACKNDSLWLAPLQRTGQHWNELALAHATRAEAASLDGLDALVADEFLPNTLRMRCLERNISVIPPRFDPVACLVVAERFAQQGRTTSSLELAPIYPREPEAVTLWNQRHPPA